jgi:hypothetical protein
VLVVVFMGVLFSPGLYVASAAPASHVMDWEPWSEAYGPMLRLMGTWGPTDRALGWYMEKCGAWDVIWLAGPEGDRPIFSSFPN